MYASPTLSALMQACVNAFAHSPFAHFDAGRTDGYQPVYALSILYIDICVSIFLLGCCRDVVRKSVLIVEGC